MPNKNKKIKQLTTLSANTLIAANTKLLDDVFHLLLHNFLKVDIDSLLKLYENIPKQLGEYIKFQITTYLSDTKSVEHDKTCHYDEKSTKYYQTIANIKLQTIIYQYDPKVDISVTKKTLQIPDQVINRIWSILHRRYIARLINDFEYDGAFQQALRKNQFDTAVKMWDIADENQKLEIINFLISFSYYSKIVSAARIRENPNIEERKFFWYFIAKHKQEMSNLKPNLHNLLQEKINLDCCKIIRDICLVEYRNNFEQFEQYINNLAWTIRMASNTGIVISIDEMRKIWSPGLAENYIIYFTPALEKVLNPLMERNHFNEIKLILESSYSSEYDYPYNLFNKLTEANKKKLIELEPDLYSKISLMLNDIKAHREVLDILRDMVGNLSEAIVSYESWIFGSFIYGTANLRNTLLRLQWAIKPVEEKIYDAIKHNKLFKLNEHIKSAKGIIDKRKANFPPALIKIIDNAVEKLDMIFAEYKYKPAAKKSQRLKF